MAAYSMTRLPDLSVSHGPSLFNNSNNGSIGQIFISLRGNRIFREGVFEQLRAEVYFGWDVGRKT